MSGISQAFHSVVERSGLDIYRLYSSTTHIAPFLSTGLESSADTLPLGGSDTHLRDDLSRLKVAVYEWGEIFCSSTHTVDVIDREHNALCVQIEHKILEVLLGRGDYNLVGELGSLKDRLNTVRMEAKQLARVRAQPDHPYPSSEPVHDER